MNKNIKYLEILNKIKLNQANDKEIRELFSFCFELAVNHLKLNYEKFFTKLSNIGLRLEDLAIESILDLFLYKKNDEINIKHYILSWRSPLKTEENVLFFLNKIVRNKVMQEIYKFIKEQDPIKEKLFKAINYFIHKNNWKKSKNSGVVYLEKNYHQNDEKKFISEEEFENILINIDEDDLENYIENIFKFLEAEKKYRVAIPLNALLRKIESDINDSFAKSNIYSKENFLDEQEIIDIVNSGLNKIQLKLKNYYLEKVMINQDEYEKIKLCFDDIGCDLIEGGVERDLYLYLLKYYPDLSKIKFKKKYKKIVEYLLRVLKNEIKEELLKKK